MSWRWQWVWDPEWKCAWYQADALLLHEWTSKTGERVAEHSNGAASAATATPTRTQPLPTTQPTTTTAARGGATTRSIAKRTQSDNNNEGASPGTPSSSPQPLGVVALSDGDLLACPHAVSLAAAMFGCLLGAPMPVSPEDIRAWILARFVVYGTEPPPPPPLVAATAVAAAAASPAALSPLLAADVPCTRHRASQAAAVAAAARDPARLLPGLVDAAVADALRRDRPGAPFADRPRSAFRVVAGRFYLARCEAAVVTNCLVSAEYQRLGMSLLFPLPALYIPAAFEHRFFEVRPSGIAGTGFGVFLRRNRRLRRGTAMLEYAGRVTPDCSDWLPPNATAKEREAHCLPYTVRTTSGKYIHGVDADGYATALASFANDAGPGGSNAEFHEVEALPDRVFVVATRDLEGGEEVYVCYGARYWGVGSYDELALGRADPAAEPVAPQRRRKQATAPATAATTTAVATDNGAPTTRSRASKEADAAPGLTARKRARTADSAATTAEASSEVLVRCRSCHQWMPRRVVRVHATACNDAAFRAMPAVVEEDPLAFNDFTTLNPYVTGGQSLDACRRAVAFVGDDLLTSSLSRETVVADRAKDSDEGSHWTTRRGATASKATRKG